MKSQFYAKRLTPAEEAKVKNRTQSYNREADVLSTLNPQFLCEVRGIPLTGKKKDLIMSSATNIS
jgi:hypothetical protein